MAQADHLPIFKASYDLCLYLEQVVERFSRSHRFGLGSEIRASARRALVLVVRARRRALADSAAAFVQAEQRRAFRVNGGSRIVWF